MSGLSPTPFYDLPVELLLQITHAIRPAKLRSFVQASKRLRMIIGPLIYNSQEITSMDDLARLRVLAGQPDIALMITKVQIDVVSLQSWWLSTGRILSSILSKLVNLNSLQIQTPYQISKELSYSLSRLQKLHTLHVNLADTNIGPDVPAISHLQHLALDLPSSPSVDSNSWGYFPYDETLGLISSSRDTLETLALHTTSYRSTTSFISHLILSPSRSFQTLLQSSLALRNVALQLEVNTSTPLTIAAIEAVSTLGPKLTSLSLKCKPCMYPDLQPSAGYGIEFAVIQSISEKLPHLEELILEDGEVGRSNNHRGSVGVVEERLQALLRLQNIRRVEFPLLFDDILYAIKKGDSPESPNTILHSIWHAAVVAQKRMEEFIDAGLVDSVDSNLLAWRNGSPPLPFLNSIIIRAKPSPKLASLLRGFRVHSGLWTTRVHVLKGLDGQDLPLPPVLIRYGKE